MPMSYALGSDRSEGNILHTISRRITYNNPGTAVAMTVGILPPGASVVSGGVNVVTTFGAADVIDVGVTGSASAYGSALDVASVGFKALDDLAQTTAVTAGYSDTAPRTVIATYTDTSADAAAGAADVIINYVTRPVT